MEAGGGDGERCCRAGMEVLYLPPFPEGAIHTSTQGLKGMIFTIVELVGVALAKKVVSKNIYV
jgi:hypothetical protein